MPDHTRPADVAGQVVLLVADAERDRYLPLCERYGTEGFAVLGGGMGDAVELLGRDGEPAARFAPATSAEDGSLVQAIERELFASE